MSKKLLCIIVLMLTLVCLLVSCDDTSSCQHTYVESIYKEPTCGTNGKGDKLFTCNLCGDSYIEYNAIPALDHDYVESILHEPSCGTNGKGDKNLTCNRCGYTYTEYDVIPALEHEWTPATCTSPKKCNVGGEYEGSSLGHEFSEADGTCTRCGYGVKFILSQTPTIISEYNSKGSLTQACKIESIKIERIQKYSYSTPYYELAFTVQRTYHKEGNNYSASAMFGWKLYDEDGVVFESGTGYTAGQIKTGEKSKETIRFYIGDDSDELQEGKTYKLELIDIS